MRKRRKGGGRKPTGRVNTAKQVCLPDNLWEIITTLTSAKGISKSEWIRKAIGNQMGRETGIW